MLSAEQLQVLTGRTSQSTTDSVQNHLLKASPEVKPDQKMVQTPIPISTLNSTQTQTQTQTQTPNPNPNSNPTPKPVATSQESGNIVFRGPVDARVACVISEEIPVTLDYQGEFGELLQKIILALKLDPKNILRLGVAATTHASASERTRAEVNLLCGHRREVILIFGMSGAEALGIKPAALPGQWIELQSASTALITYDLFSILNKSDLKKKTWSHLQGAMKRLGTFS